MFDSMWVAMWLRVEYGSVRNKSAHYYIANYLYESNIWVDDKWVEFRGGFSTGMHAQNGDSDVLRTVASTALWRCTQREGFVGLDRSDLHQL